VKAHRLLLAASSTTKNFGNRASNAPFLVFAQVHPLFAHSTMKTLQMPIAFNDFSVSAQVHPLFADSTTTI
jgi:hypothetical protein